ncbi:MAG: NADH-quinone oxidoreductase subunit NuoK [Planctomycetota bacterium]|jgi:NADH-quinone oxidoreductase subunit K|nr:NADH-quinone oxidoreductase subunit NuoK [Planctomycetota bacterium]MDP6942022.1 NADH-quinone oxidoreductase subunit NuoK [Planctomycetota bacterium]
MSLTAYLAVATCLFIIGLVMVAARRNLVYVLMGLELILNAANLNFVAFNRFQPGSALDGQIASIFVIILAAAEAAVALAIVLNAHALFDTIRPDDYYTMKD